MHSRIQRANSESTVPMSAKEHDDLDVATTVTTSHESSSTATLTAASTKRHQGYIATLQSKSSAWEALIHGNFS